MVSNFVGKHLSMSLWTSKTIVVVLNEFGMENMLEMYFFFYLFDASFLSTNA